VALRQQSSFVPFLHGWPLELTQLSTGFCAVAWANALDAKTASVADAKSEATLFSFFMILLLREGAG
jgi:hypothetical protein